MRKRTQKTQVLDTRRLVVDKKYAIGQCFRRCQYGALTLWNEHMKIDTQQVERSGVVEWPPLGGWIGGQSCVQV